MEDKVKEISTAIQKQLSSFWNIKICEQIELEENIKTALKRTEESFMASQNKYFINNGFSLYNSVQYSIFLYYLANTIGKNTGGGICRSNLLSE